jgi:hypothetical protein
MAAGGERTMVNATQERVAVEGKSMSRTSGVNRSGVRRRHHCRERARKEAKPGKRLTGREGSRDPSSPRKRLMGQEGSRDPLLPLALPPFVHNLTDMKKGRRGHHHHRAWVVALIYRMVSPIEIC